MTEPAPGLYEALITKALERRLPKDLVVRAGLDPAEAADTLARHIARPRATRAARSRDNH